MPATIGGYELVKRIAVGGMAEVFLARKPGPEGFEKRVALKRILPHLAAQPDFVAMFLDEARLASPLAHPHIVQIHELGVDGGSFFLAMELVTGEDLASLIRRGRHAGAPIDLADAATILVAACEALHHAHEQGIIHRDVTPSNLLVSYDGAVKLADFGIAKAKTRAPQTQAGALKGKVPYMSPEQARGQALDRRSDVFSLGICAWELITGRRLYLRDNEIELLKVVQAADVPRIRRQRRDVPRELERLVLTALAREPDGRWPTARAFSEALLAWLAGIGAAPSQARLAAYMRRLFGDDAASRALAACDGPVESTEVLAQMAPADAPTPTPGLPGPIAEGRARQMAQAFAQAPQALLHHVAQLPMHLHLHLPPLRLPRWRLILPLCALLLSGVGLLLAHRSPYAHGPTPVGSGGVDPDRLYVPRSLMAPAPSSLEPKKRAPARKRTHRSIVGRPEGGRP